MHIPESIGETFGEQVCEARSLLIGKTGGHVVVLRVSQVNLRVRHIEVAACDDRLLLIQLRKIIGVKLVPLLPLAQPLEPIARVRRIHIHKIEILTFKDDQPSLVIHRVGSSDPRNDLLQFEPLLIEDHRSRIPLPCGRLRAHPFGVIIGKVLLHRLYMLLGRTRRRQLRLLNRDDIGIFAFKRIQHVPGHLRSRRRRGQRCIQGIYIPGNQFQHMLLLFVN